MASDDPLAGLRPIRLPPETTSYWSDVGFSVALGLGLALLAVLVLRAIWRPRLSVRKAALGAFEETRGLPPDERRAAQAAILRRVVKSVEGEDAARATGGDWAATLDRVFATDLFSAREGRIFSEGLYARPIAAAANDDEALDRELGGLLARIRA